MTFYKIHKFALLLDQYQQYYVNVLFDLAKLLCISTGDVLFLTSTVSSWMCWQSISATYIRNQDCSWACGYPLELRVQEMVNSHSWHRVWTEAEFCSVSDAIGYRVTSAGLELDVLAIKISNTSNLISPNFHTIEGKITTKLRPTTSVDDGSRARKASRYFSRPQQGVVVFTKRRTK